jgi:hypothetical protein
VLDGERRVLAASSRFCAEHGLADHTLRGERFDRVHGGRFATPAITGVIDRLLTGDGTLDELQHGHSLRDHDNVSWRIAGCRVPGPAVAVLLSIERDEPVAAPPTTRLPEP